VGAVRLSLNSSLQCLRELQFSWEKINKNNLENVLLAPQYGIKILLHLKNDNKQNKKIHQK
jgi:hypothetical protein